MDTEDVQKDQESNQKTDKEAHEQEVMKTDPEITGDVTQTGETEITEELKKEGWTVLKMDTEEGVTDLSEKEGGQEIEVEELTCAYQVNFYSDTERQTLRVGFVPDKAVKINDELITLDEVRYASKRSYKGFPQKAAHCIILSYSDKLTKGVKHYFLEMATVEDTTELSEDFQKLLKSKFLAMNKEEDSTTDTDCYNTVADQPIYFGGADIKVKNTKDGTVVYEGHSVVVLDIECLAIYPVVESELGEPYRLMFWQEEGEKTVEKILQYHKDNKIVFETTTFSYEMPVIEGVVAQLHELQPKPKNVLADKPILSQWVSNSTRTRKTPSSASSSLYPGIHGEYQAEASARPVVEPTRNWEQTDYEQQTDEQIERSIMTELNREINNAVKEFETAEDIQMYWISVEADLNEFIESGTVPETDHFSGGLDPNCADHLKRAVDDVADQLKEQKFDIAVSRIQAARRVFHVSPNAEIRRFFQSNDMDLLKKLYFRSLVR